MRYGGALLLLICAACSSEQSAPVDPPNVVIMFADDLEYADIGAFGDPDYPTPNLDRMGR